MSPTLDVRGLTVLFAGESGHDPSGTSVRALMLDPAFEAILRRVPGHRPGLLGVTFTVNAGECLAVLGTSGSGKSSLLRTIAGLQPLAAGSIHVTGRDVTDLPPEQRSVVYLHQEPVLFPHLSVLANVAFPMSVRGIAKRDAHRRAFDMLALLRVADVAHNAASALSGGQRHRVALARALCADPAVLLLDEPLSSLDPAIRSDVRAALLQVRAMSGAATILVTHDLDDAMAVATHIAAIGESATLSVPAGPAALLDAPPTLQIAQLLGVYSTLDGVVVLRAGSMVFRWMGGEIAAPDAALGAAVACVRSHEAQVHSGDTLDAPVLTVTARRDSAHAVVLDLSDAVGGTATVRTASDTAAQVGDRVQVQLRRARFFPAR